jgi:hypothetical protein
VVDRVSLVLLDETLAAELAELVDDTWETTAGIANMMIMANGATVPGVLPAPGPGAGGPDAGGPGAGGPGAAVAVVGVTG